MEQRIIINHTAREITTFDFTDELLEEGRWECDDHIVNRRAITRPHYYTGAGTARVEVQRWYIGGVALDDYNVITP